MLRLLISLTTPGALVAVSRLGDDEITFPAS
jgi:hypothetical protein